MFVSIDLLAGTVVFMLSLHAVHCSGSMVTASVWWSSCVLLLQLTASGFSYFHTLQICCYFTAIFAVLTLYTEQAAKLELHEFQS